MYLGALNESPSDTRVALTPPTIKEYCKAGFTVICEEGAYDKAGFCAQEYQEAGAIVTKKKEILQKAAILLCVSLPPIATLDNLSPHALLIGPVENQPQSEWFQKAQGRKISLFSMHFIPRISRAQTMDSLSSQANLAGYKAVLEAVSAYHQVVPMMMTAAGMIHPAKVLVLGAGVAGLQAIATAKRLGAVVSAFDVRQEAKEQVESLGAEFLAVDSEKPIEKYIAMADILITTALVPGKKAPILVHESAVEKMKPGSIIVDLASKYGGNCTLTVADKCILYKGVTIMGESNMAGLLPRTASYLYAQNMLAVVRMIAPTGITFDWNEKEEILQQALLSHDGKYLPFPRGA